MQVKKKYAFLLIVGIKEQQNNKITVGAKAMTGIGGKMKKKDVNERAVNEFTGTENKTQTFDEMLKNKEYQAEFDRRIQKAIKTVRAKWKTENEEQKSKNDKSLKKRTITINLNKTPISLKITI